LWCRATTTRSTSANASPAHRDYERGRARASARRPWPKIELDLTADEKLVLPKVEREVFQPYSDRPNDGIWINCYSYEEAFAGKARALGERTRPRDLYDVVNLYRHTDSRPSASVLLDVLRQKTFKGIPRGPR
jgi:predicted nucleotidyltransferase component of viral defense system